MRNMEVTIGIQKRQIYELRMEIERGIKKEVKRTEEEMGATEDTRVEASVFEDTKHGEENGEDTEHSSEEHGEEHREEHGEEYGEDQYSEKYCETTHGSWSRAEY